MIGASEFDESHPPVLQVTLHMFAIPGLLHHEDKLEHVEISEQDPEAKWMIKVNGVPYRRPMV